MGNTDSDYGRRHWGGVGMGLAVIAIGLFFLAQNFGIRLPFMDRHNWWALFILIAAVGPLAQALQRFRTQGRVDNGVLCSLLSAAAFVMVAMLFLLDLSWELWWPVFIIYGGLWMLVRGGNGKSGAEQPKN
jgi:hypothetical protein